MGGARLTRRMHGSLLELFCIPPSAAERWKPPVDVKYKVDVPHPLEGSACHGPIGL